eukprot:117194-Prymnesium_polylepis.1
MSSSSIHIDYNQPLVGGLSGILPPPGTYSTSTSLASAVECETCPVGFVCELGTSVPRPVCGENQYRPLGNSSASECVPCDAIPGIICDANPTIATLNLTAGYWRHSVATNETHRCKSDGSWIPCTVGHASINIRYNALKFDTVLARA